MATYVSLINWTDEGVKNFRDTTKRAAEFTKQVEAHGGKVRELLWTVGEYDLVSVVDWPDEESSVATLLMTAGAGNIRTNTLRAFSSREMDGIIARAS
ncbi:MAG TPA: GYD domain-containing protein [Acidimicrobiales bacterium]|nr:GYD domain-containing protein [Acidimicrobiales bacterium]